MTPILFLIGIVFGLVVGWSLVARAKRPKHLTVAEYWVFLPEARIPEQDAVMVRMVAQNPYSKRGQSPIGTAEGLLFSDIRLHIALVLRSKNPQAFRPDLFSGATEMTAEALEALAKAEAFVKVRYLSEQPLHERRHLQFLIHAADAYAELGNSSLVFDQTASRFLSRAELSQTLKENFDASGADVHTRVTWNLEGDHGYAETRGMAKVGHHEIRTVEVSPDEQVVVTQVLEAAVRILWTEPVLPPSVDVELFDDKFQVLLEPRHQAPTKARILRYQNA